MLTHTVRAKLTAQDLIQIDEALLTLETKLGFTLGIEGGDRLALHGLGPQNKAFADRAFEGASLNADLIPNALRIEEIEADKTLREQLMPRYERFRSLNTRMENTLMLIGSEYYAGALAIYQALKALGNRAGLDELLAELKRHFRKTKSGNDAGPVTTTPES